MIESILQYAHYIVSILVIFLVFIQPSKGGMGSLLSSGGGSESKKIDFLTKFTFCIVISFMLVSAGIVYTQANKEDDGELFSIEKYSTEED